MKNAVLVFFLILAMSTTVTAQKATSSPVGQKVETGDRFEIQGTITSVNDSSFIVRGELVAATSENMARFKSNHLLTKGNFVSVKGNIRNNIMMAKDIEVYGKNPEAEMTLTDQVKPHITPSPTDNTVVDNIVDAIKSILFK